MVLLKAHLSLSLGEGKVGFFAAIFFKSPPFLSREGKVGFFAAIFFFFKQQPLGREDGGKKSCRIPSHGS